MRVLMLGWEFPPYQAGGLATATMGLVKGLLRRGVEVSLVVPFPAQGASLSGLRLVSAVGERTRLQTIRVASPLAPYMRASEYVRVHARTIHGPGPSAVYGRDLLEEVERFAEVVAELAGEEPHDIIDAHDWMAYEAGLRAQRVSGRPLIAHIHATEFDRSGDDPNLEIFARERHGMAAATLVVANSHVLKRQVTLRYQIPEWKVAVVHWGIEEDRPEYHLEPSYPFPPTTPVVLFLGRVTRQKGPDYFIEVARRVADFVPEARFIIAGSGDLFPRLVERAVELNLADRVHFTGGLEGQDVYRVLRLANICLMPSVSEPFGLVALESLKSGTPCLVPRESGVAEVLRHTLKIDFWDIEEMTNKIVAILRYPELQTELREGGRAEVGARRFGLDEPARQTEELYRWVVAGFEQPVEALA